MNIDFCEKRLQQYRSYFQVSSKTHDHIHSFKFWGKSLSPIWGIPQKFPVKYLENGLSCDDQTRYSGAER